jgi:hypothetical protein
MSNDMNRLSDDELNSMVNDFVDSGGAVTRLRYATQNDIGKARRTMYHKDKAISGSQRSQDALERDKEKEKTMIFSKVDRWKEE